MGLGVGAATATGAEVAADAAAAGVADAAAAGVADAALAGAVEAPLAAGAFDATTALGFGAADAAAGAAAAGLGADALSAAGPVIGGATDLLSAGTTPALASGVSTAIPGATEAASALGAAPTLSTAGPGAASVAGPAGVAAGAPVDLTAASPTAGFATPSTASAVGAETGGASAAPAASALDAAPTPVAGGGVLTDPGTYTGPQLTLPDGSVVANPNAVAVGPTPSGAPLGPGGVATTPSTGILDTIGNAIGSPTGKLVGAGIAAAGLGMDLLKGNSIPGLSNIQNLASSSAAQGQILQSYLETGTLPPAVQASINAATQDGITAIKAKYANMGVAPGSSQEVQDIAVLQQQAVIQGATLADQLLAQGISETQLSGELYNSLVSANTALNTQTGQAISALAGALAGGGTTIKLAA